LLMSPRLLWIAGGALIVLGLIPGLPKLPFFCIAGILMYAASQMKPQLDSDGLDEVDLATKVVVAGSSQTTTDPMDAALRLDELMLEVGPGLVPLVDTQQGGQLLSRVKAMRKNLAQQLGFLIPSIHITDDLSLRDREYVIYMRGVEIARWELRKDSLLAISSKMDAAELPGHHTREPAFGSTATWIAPHTQGQAIAAGYAVVDPTSVLAAHLTELVRQHAHDILSRGETKRLIDRLGESHPKLAEELIPKVLSLGEVQKVLQQLLREQVGIRDLGTILETLVDTAAFNKNPVALVEACRHALGRSFIQPLLDEKGELQVVTLDPAIEDECARSSSQQISQALATQQQAAIARRILDGLRSVFGNEVNSAPPVLLCASPSRYFLRRMLEPFIPKIIVISPNEIPALTRVESVGVIR
jgi:flagellar biosynthesis protein FlhA